MWTKNLNVIKTKSNHGWNPGGLRYSIEQLKVLMTGFNCIYILPNLPSLPVVGRFTGIFKLLTSIDSISSARILNAVLKGNVFKGKH